MIASSKDHPKKGGSENPFKGLLIGVVASIILWIIIIFLFKTFFMSIEQKASYYDEIYASSESYSEHYANSPYYKLWQQVVSVLPLSQKILEVGCGTGQFAHLLSDMGVDRYCGIDISEVAIKKSEERLPDLTFIQKSAYTAFDILAVNEIIVCLETLEHIDDLKFLNTLPMGITIVFTVPDFNDPAHVRYFKNITEIVFRYYQKINFSHIEKYERWFICKGVTI